MFGGVGAAVRVEPAAVCHRSTDVCSYLTFVGKLGLSLTPTPSPLRTRHALKPLAWHWSHWPAIGAIGLVYPP